MKITIKDALGDVRTLSGKNLKVWRDGNTVEIYYNKPIDGDSKKVILAVAVNPVLVHIEEPQKIQQIAEADPFTKKALIDVKTESPEEILELYNALLPKKRKRRTKAEMKAAREKENGSA